MEVLVELSSSPYDSSNAELKSEKSIPGASTAEILHYAVYYRKSVKGAVNTVMSSLWSTLLILTISATSLYAARTSYIAIVNLRKYEERSERAAKYSETAAHQLYKTRVTQASSAAAVRPSAYSNSSGYNTKLTSDTVVCRSFSAC